APKESSQMRSSLLAAVAVAAMCASTSAAQQMEQMGKKMSAVSPDPSDYGFAVHDAYDRIRKATEPFKQLSAAVAAGYAASVDLCYADAEHGAMGYHHINKEYVDRTLDVEHPEIL